MADLKDRLSKMITRLARKLEDLSVLPDYGHVRPVPQPPASAQRIQEYERHLGLRLPPSYRALLSLHDGYEWLFYPGHLLSIADLMPGGRWEARVQSWKRTSARYGSDEVLEGIPIANLGQPNSWVYLDPGRIDARGELTVVEWDPEESEEYADVLEYLEECEQTVQYGIDEAAGDAGGAGDTPGE